MQIIFASGRLLKTCTDPKIRQQRLGVERGTKVFLRLTQLRASTTLKELATLPQARLHQLTKNRDEQFSVDLDGPYRLIFEVLDDPIPRLPDGGIDVTQVRGVRILEIADPH
jgi:plasmid maintenance system killer protein